MIALTILLGLVALGFLLKFKVDYNIKVLHNRIRSGEVGMYVSYFDGEERHFGYIMKYNNDYDIQVMYEDHLYDIVMLGNIYPPKPF